MKEMTGESYESSKHAKALTVAEAKVGKTCFLTASILGVMPQQKFGGVVDRPEHLHIMTFDADAVGGVKDFLVKTCGARPEALKFKVWNLQDDMRRTSETESDYSMDFYNAVMTTIDRIREQVARGGIHAVVTSSLTGLAAGIERAIIGPPSGPGYSDPSKWNALAHQLREIQNFMQIDDWHLFWEGHIDKPPPAPMKSANNAPKESISVTGKAGRNWAYNCEQVFRIRRMFGQKEGATKVDKVFLDTVASLDFVANGRGFGERLNPQEPDLTVALHKLGKTVGRWGAKSAPVKKVAAVK